MRFSSIATRLLVLWPCCGVESVLTNGDGRFNDEPSMAREAILDAIRARHTYGTTAARIFLEVRVNGHLIRDKLPASDGKPVEVKVSARCPGDIDRIEVCRNNQFVYTSKPEGRLPVRG